MLDELLTFKPMLHGKIWGGDKIFRLLEKGDGKQNNIGESWELSDNDTEQSVIAQGIFHDQSFRLVFQKYAKDILGIHYRQDILRFPLLYKFIDASQELSVQVHPGENSRLGDSKTEAWYVVDAPANAEIIVGISSRLPQREILEALKSSRATSVLNSIPVQRGDVLFLPAGTVHSITKGLLIYEVQQNSDTTFRLYDWDRVDPQGNPRELHIDKAAQVIDYTVHDQHKISPLSIETEECLLTFLVACKHFCLQKYSDFRKGGRVRSNDPFMKGVKVKSNNHFRVFTCMRGRFHLSTEKSRYTLKLGETMLMPAICPEIIIEDLHGGSELVSSFIPLVKEEIAEPLLEAGYQKETIEQLAGKERLSW